MTLEASVLDDDAVRATRAGYEVDVHLAWYRSLPLSCVEDISITIAGRTIARDDIRVLRAGRQWALDELANLVDEEWFVQDALTFVLPDASPKKPGSEIDVLLTLATRIPYIIIGPGKALVKPTRVQRKVVVQ
jgi:Domain of unknown function (DUF6379)